MCSAAARPVRTPRMPAGAAQRLWRVQAGRRATHPAGEPAARRGPVVGALRRRGIRRQGRELRRDDAARRGRGQAPPGRRGPGVDAHLHTGPCGGDCAAGGGGPAGRRVTSPTRANARGSSSRGASSRSAAERPSSPRRRAPSTRRLRRAPPHSVLRTPARPRSDCRRSGRGPRRWRRTSARRASRPLTRRGAGRATALCYNEAPMRVLMVAPTPFFGDRGCHIRILEEVRALPRPRRRDPRGDLCGRPRPSGGSDGPHAARAVGERCRRLLAPSALSGWTPPRHDAPGGPALPPGHPARPSPRGRGNRRGVGRLVRRPAVADLQGSVAGEMIAHGHLPAGGPIPAALRRSSVRSSTGPPGCSRPPPISRATSSTSGAPPGASCCSRTGSIRVPAARPGAGCAA